MCQKSDEMKKDYKLRVKLVFRGELQVKAHSRKEAEEYAERLQIIAAIEPLKEPGDETEVSMTKRATIGSVSVNRSEEKGGEAV